MRRIEKGAPPSCIAELVGTPGANWSSVHGDQKKQMRAHFANEQHQLCAYCMKRVPEIVVVDADGKTDTDFAFSVEHYRTRALHPDLQFAWSNLIGVCEGDVGVQAASTADKSNPRFRCDNHRGKITRVEDQELFVDPTRLIDPDKTFRYTLAGVIEPAANVEASRRGEIETTIARLNLNIWRLKRNRAAVREKIRGRVENEFKRRSDGDARRVLRKWLSVVGEYAEVEHAYLRKTLR